MKALVGAFNQEKALVGAFSVIVQLHRLIVYSTSCDLWAQVRGQQGPGRGQAWAAASDLPGGDQPRHVDAQHPGDQQDRRAPHTGQQCVDNI